MTEKRKVEESTAEKERRGEEKKAEGSVVVITRNSKYEGAEPKSRGVLSKARR